MSETFMGQTDTGSYLRTFYPRLVYEIPVQEVSSAQGSPQSGDYKATHLSLQVLL